MTAAPTNLTALALDDYDAMLIESLSWGAANSAKTRALLLKHFADIERGVAAGHVRDDIPFKVETRSIRVGRTPYLIFYRPGERLVVRIVHGRRNLPALFVNVSARTQIPQRWSDEIRSAPTSSRIVRTLRA